MTVDLWISIGFSSVLLLSAAALLIGHRRAWREAVAEAEDADELAYRRRQFRRRVQTSLMLALIAIALPVGQWLTIAIGSLLFAAIYWSGVLVMVGWVMLLAGADILATKMYFTRRRNHNSVERAKLRAQLRRAGLERLEGGEDD